MTLVDLLVLIAGGAYGLFLFMITALAISLVLGDSWSWLRSRLGK